MLRGTGQFQALTGQNYRVPGEIVSVGGGGGSNGDGGCCSGGGGGGDGVTVSCVSLQDQEVVTGCDVAAPAVL